MNYRYFILIILLFNCFLGAHAEQTATPVAAVEQQKEQSSKLSQALADRAEKRWRALLRKDWKTAFEYFSPSYREVYELETFTDQFGRVTWLNFKIHDTAVHEQENNALIGKATVEIFFYVFIPGNPKPIVSSSLMNERWLYKDDQWWFVAVEEG